MHGDLREKYENEIIINPVNGHSKDVMVLMNVMCGNIRMDCAYANHLYLNWQMHEHECHELCLDQYWDVGFDDWQSPCEGRIGSTPVDEPLLKNGNSTPIWDDDNWGMENLFYDEVRDLHLLIHVI